MNLPPLVSRHLGRIPPRRKKQGRKEGRNSIVDPRGTELGKLSRRGKNGRSWLSRVKQIVDEGQEIERRREEPRAQIFSSSMKISLFFFFSSSSSSSVETSSSVEPTTSSVVVVVVVVAASVHKRNESRRFLGEGCSLEIARIREIGKRRRSSSSSEINDDNVAFFFFFTLKRSISRFQLKNSPIHQIVPLIEIVYHQTRANREKLSLIDRLSLSRSLTLCRVSSRFYPTHTSDGKECRIFTIDPSTGRNIVDDPATDDPTTGVD